MEDIEHVAVVAAVCVPTAFDVQNAIFVAIPDYTAAGVINAEMKLAVVDYTLVVEQNQPMQPLLDNLLL